MLTEKQRSERNRVWKQLGVIRDRLFHMGLDRDAYRLATAIRDMQADAEQQERAERRRAEAPGAWFPHNTGLE